MKIFKYESITPNTKKNLQESQIYFNAPINYNDPYEGVFKFHISNDFLKKKLIKNLSGLVYDKKVFSNLSIGEVIEEIRIEYVNQYLNDVRVACFSKRKDSMLMWSHYSNEHKGICLEFESENILFKIGDDVKYSKKIPILYISNSNDLEEDSLMHAYSKIVHTKEMDWQYEKEYRLFGNNSDNIKKYNPNDLKAIYFGLRCEKEEIEKIIFSVPNPNVNFFKCELELDEYKFRFLPL